MNAPADQIVHPHIYPETNSPKQHLGRGFPIDGRRIELHMDASVQRDFNGFSADAEAVLRAMSVTHEIGDLLHSTRSVDEILQLILVGVTGGLGAGKSTVARLLGHFAMLVGEHEADTRPV